MNNKSLSLKRHPSTFVNGLVAGKSWKKILEEQVPILVWLPRYPKENLSADLAGAMTLGCILIGDVDGKGFETVHSFTT